MASPRGGLPQPTHSEAVLVRAARLAHDEYLPLIASATARAPLRLAWRARRAAGAPGQPGLLPAVARPEGAARVASGWSARRSGDERVEADRRHRQLDGEPERAGGIGLARPEGLELALPTIVVDGVDVLAEALRVP